MDTITGPAGVTDWFDHQPNVDLALAWLLCCGDPTPREVAEFIYRPYEYEEFYIAATTWEMSNPIDAMCAVVELTRTGDADPD